MEASEAGPKFLAPLLVAGDFATTLAFYRTTLGLPFVGDRPYAECRTASALLSIVDREFIGRTKELDTAMVGGPGAAAQTVLTVEVPDVEETFERLVVSGVRFLSPPSTRLPLGRRYAFLRDPDGRTVALMGPRLPNVV